MKTLIRILCLLMGFVLFAFTFSRENNKKFSVTVADTSSNYQDGVYEAYSQDGYTAEPYWGHIQIRVEGGSFTQVLFTIRDSTTHEPVDSMYGVIHYSSIPLYMQQCVNDGHGIEEYPVRLMEKQDLDKVDAITGATWSYNIFKASAEKALEDGLRPEGLHENGANETMGMQVWPNPSDGAVNFEYTLAKSVMVNFRIYDEKGMMIDQMVNRTQSAGVHKLRWNIRSSGLYYYQLSTGEVIMSGRFIGKK